MTTLDDTPTTVSVGRRCILEQIGQACDELPGGDRFRDGTGPRVPMAFGIAPMARHARHARAMAAFAALDGNVTWMHLLRRATFAAMAEDDWPVLRAHLLAVAAVCTQWIADGDTRS